jgi:glycosyltransferase involved in cell wall biosynthesis
MDKINIIFILYNIYETVNGVSTKYIKFIKYLAAFHHVTLITTFNHYEKVSENIHMIKTKGLNIPFYKDIKVPIVSKKDLKKLIKHGNEIIIFNGEFIWLYETLYSLKKKYKDIKIYPNMHTDYFFYCNNIYKIYNFNFVSTLNYLDDYLEKKKFHGIIVTGDKMKEKYTNFTENIFNANEVNLDIFSYYKIDSYDNHFYNIIYCGRISKEKNIDEFLDCCLLLNKYSIKIHIIGDGPYKDELINIINLKYNKLKDNIHFYGTKSQEEINDIYQNLNNRIFIYTSISETFGKTPMEAIATGIPLFIKKSDITDYLYINKKNAFIFNDQNTFIDSFDLFLSLDENDKKKFILNSIENIQKYNQNDIFNEWMEFIVEGKIIKNKVKIHLLDIFTFHTISKLISCTGNILGD